MFFILPLSSRIISEDCGEDELEKLNGSKFELSRYGNKEDIKENTVYFTPGHEDVIDQQENIKDLGNFLSADMKFS